MCVCLFVTFLLILPSPCQAADIYKIMKCLYVCVFVTFLLIFVCPNCQIAAHSSCWLPLCALATWHRQQLKVYYDYYECRCHDDDD